MIVRIRVGVESRSGVVTARADSVVNKEPVFDLTVVVFSPESVPFVWNKYPADKRSKLFIPAGKILEVRGCLS